MTDPSEWPDPADKAHSLAQAKRLRDEAAQGGLRYEGYLPPDLAPWLLDMIAQGVFIDPSEAVFVMLGVNRDLEHHADLRHELLKRTIQAAADDPRPSATAVEVAARMRERLKQPTPQPAMWERRPLGQTN